jgi:hypothetical protein
VSVLVVGVPGKVPAVVVGDVAGDVLLGVLPGAVPVFAVGPVVAGVAAVGEPDAGCVEGDAPVVIDGCVPSAVTLVPEGAITALSLPPPLPPQAVKTAHANITLVHSALYTMRVCVSALQVWV